VRREDKESRKRMKLIDRRINKACLILFVLALIFFMGGRVGAWASDMEKVIDPEILARLDQGETVDVIVLLKGYQDYMGKVSADDPAQMATIQGEINSQQDVVLNRLDPCHFKLRRRFENILGFSGTVTQEGLLALAAMPEVELIETDEIVQVHSTQGIPFYGGPGAAGLGLCGSEAGQLGEEGTRVPE
jgi:hypothetical protein